VFPNKRGAGVPGCGDETRLRVADVDRVGQLDEVGLFGLEDLLEVVEGPELIVGDADVLDPAVRLHGAKRLEMRLPVEEVVNLHQLKLLAAELCSGVGHLVDAGLLAADPDLGGDEEAVVDAELGREIASDLLRSAVHGRRIDQPPAGVVEDLEDFRQPFHRLTVIGFLVEGLPGAHTDRGDRFLGAGDESGEHFGCLGRRVSGKDARRQHRQRRRAREVKKLSPRERHRLMVVAARANVRIPHPHLVPGMPGVTPQLSYARRQMKPFIAVPTSDDKLQSRSAEIDRNHDVRHG
jgi:hypothetical protein